MGENGFFFPQWRQVEDEDEQWRFYQGDTLVGEVYRYLDEGDAPFRYHCKSSDWRGTTATIEEAKARCEASFWQEEFLRVCERINDPSLPRQTQQAFAKDRS